MQNVRCGYLNGSCDCAVREGTPRIANSLLRRVGVAQIKGDGKIDINITKSSLKALNVDNGGLVKWIIRY